MERRRFVLIGAGSASFTQGLVADLIVSGRPWHLGLVDIDPHAMQVAAGLGSRMVQAREADILIEASTDRRDLLPGADVVVTTIGVGGRRAWEADVLIPRKYGVYQPVGDTVMPGGISRGLRMVPAMVEIARDVLRLCPQARFFNYANPMTVNCWSVRRATGADVTGLCHGVMQVARELAQFMGAPPTEVTCLAAGVNHFTWIYDLRWKRRDAWPLVRVRLSERRGEKVDYSQLGRDLPEIGRRSAVAAEDLGNPFCWSLFDDYGAYPAVNDRHVTEFFPRQFPKGRYYGKTLGIDAFSFEDTIAYGDRTFERMRAQAAGDLPLDEGLFRRTAGEHEQIVDILESMAGDQRRVFSANLPSRGAVPGLPDEAVLEVPAVATARGFRALQVPDLTPAMLELLKATLATQWLTVEAALTGSRKLFVEALLADGAVAEPAIAERLADELLQAQKQYLPQFA